MAEFEIIALDVAGTELQAPEAGDSYVAKRPVHFEQTLQVDGLINGRNVAADGAAASTALQPGANVSVLTNDSGFQANAPIASQGEAEAGVNNTNTMTPLRVAQALAVLAAGLKNNYVAVVDPVATDDDSEGYSAGSYWINTLTEEVYRCVDPTTNVAVWVKTTLTSDELATIALTGNSDDLTEGAVKLLLTALERAKLAAIEPLATADQTGAEIKALYEAEPDTNAFTDLDKLKLDALSGITLAIVANPGGGQGSAVALTTRFNIVETVATTGDSVKLPDPGNHTVIIVKNIGANACDVFPDVGDTINKLAINVAISVPADTTKYFFTTSSSHWETL